MDVAGSVVKVLEVGVVRVVGVVKEYGRAQTRGRLRNLRNLTKESLRNARLKRAGELSCIRVHYAIPPNPPSSQPSLLHPLGRSGLRTQNADSPLPPPQRVMQLMKVAVAARVRSILLLQITIPSHPVSSHLVPYRPTPSRPAPPRPNPITSHPIPSRPMPSHPVPPQSHLVPSCRGAIPSSGLSRQITETRWTLWTPPGSGGDPGSGDPGFGDPESGDPPSVDDNRRNDGVGTRAAGGARARADGRS